MAATFIVTLDYFHHVVLTVIPDEYEGRTVSVSSLRLYFTSFLILSFDHEVIFHMIADMMYVT